MTELTKEQLADYADCIDEGYPIPIADQVKLLAHIRALEAKFADQEESVRSTVIELDNALGLLAERDEKLGQVEELRDAWEVMRDDFYKAAQEYTRNGECSWADEAERLAGHMQLRIDALDAILNGSKT